jgi:hypothetical protein
VPDRVPLTPASDEEDTDETDEQEEDRLRIETFIRDFARQLKDRAPLPSSTARAFNLYRGANLPLRAFTQMLYRARETTLGAAGVRNRMAYFFTVLEHDLHEAGLDGQAARHATME